MFGAKRLHYQGLQGALETRGGEGRIHNGRESRAEEIL